jgi:serine/threonine protein kinase/WD40 repeat protein
MGNSSSSIDGGHIRTYNFKAEGPVLYAALLPEKNAVLALGATFMECFDVHDFGRKWISFVESVVCADVDPNAQEVYCGCSDGKVRVYETESGKVLHAFVPGGVADTLAPPVSAIAVLSSSQLVVGLQTGVAVVVDPRNEQLLLTLSPPEVPAGTAPSFSSAVHAIAYDASRQHIWLGYVDGVIRCFEYPSGKRILQLGSSNAAKAAAVRCMLVVPTHDVLLFGVANKSFHVWDLAAGRELVSYQFDVVRLVYDESHDVVFSGGELGHFSLWRVPRDRQPAPLVLLRKHEMHSRSLWCISYSAKVDALLTAGLDAVVKLLPHAHDTILKDVAPAAKTVSETSKSPEKLSETPAVAPAQKPSTSPGSSATASRAASSSTAAMDEATAATLLSELTSDSDILFEPSSSALSKSSAAPTDLARMELLFGKVIETLASNGSPETEGLASLLQSGYSNLQESLVNELKSSAANMAHVRRQVFSRHRAILDPSHGRAQLAAKKAEKIAEMRARHARELADLEEFYEEELKRFDAALSPGQMLAASEYAAARMAQTSRNADLESAVVNQMRSLLLSALPQKQFSEMIKLVCTVNSRASKVYRGLDLRSVECCAVKVLPARVPLNTALQHENLVRVLDIQKQEKATFVVMELMPYSLYDFVGSDRVVHSSQASLGDQQLSSKDIAAIVYDLASALEYLHSQGMVHRDLRPDNVLVVPDDDASGGSRWRAKVVHMGLMKALTGTEVDEDGVVYAAPEQWCKTISTLSDMWSLGCLIVRLFQTTAERAQPLFSGSNAQEVFASVSKVVPIPDDVVLQRVASDNKMTEGNASLYVSLSLHQTEKRVPLESIVSQAPLEAVALVKHLLCVDPAERLSAAEVLRHQFLHRFLESTSHRKPRQPVLVAETGDSQVPHGSTDSEHAPIIHDVGVISLPSPDSSDKIGVDVDDEVEQLLRASAKVSLDLPTDLDADVDTQGAR